MMEKWKRIRKDEYIFNNKVSRMTKEKRERVNQMDKAVVQDKRYA